MKTINLLASNNAVGSSLLGVIDFVDFANTFWRYLHPTDKKPLLAYRLYAWNGEQIQLSNGLKIDALPLSKYKPAEVDFLISSFVTNTESLNLFLHSAQVFKPILKQAVASEGLVVSYCTGTFGLASCGILDNRSATTVWWLANQFQSHFPKVNLDLDELVVQDENVITGGATTSYFNVCLRVLERLTNELFAGKLAKLLLMDRQRLSQRAFIDSGFIVNKQDELVERIQAWMLENYNQAITLERLCDQFNVTKRTLNRRFKASCNETPMSYLQKIRIEQAKHYLETTGMAVERIVEKVGYSDTASFRKLFVNQTQLTPKVYRQRFSIQPQQAECC